MDFENKVVLVTGSASGIGEATALAFSKLKAKLSLVDVDKENLNIVLEKCKNAGASDVLQVSADLTKDEEVKRVVESTINEYGRIDVLVNGAGIFLEGDNILNERILDIYDKVISINLRAAVALTNLAVPALTKTKGSVINISSVQAVTITCSNLSYGMAKAGLRHFTKCVALELAPNGVRVNCILPGPVKTNLLINSGFTVDKSDQSWNNMKQGVPLNKFIEAEEIADMIVYLASEKARSITGAAYEVDGGWTLVGHPAPLAKELEKVHP